MQRLRQLLKKLFPFNAEQTINIASEFGPLVTMFVVNAIWGIDAGTWALVITTFMAIGVMYYMFHRPPVFPLIASTVTIVFGTLTLVTGNPMWVQIKVTIFNALFALFLIGGLLIKHNFFKFVFNETFHYTDEGWNKFTLSFALFFIATAIANEYVRQTFLDDHMYNVLGHDMNGVNIWILFKIAIVLPVTLIFAWLLTRALQKHRLPDPPPHPHGTTDQTPERKPEPAETPTALHADVAAAKTENQHMKLLLDLGPLLAFFLTYFLADKVLTNPKDAIYWSTGVLIATTLASLVASKVLLGHVAAMPLVTAALVVVFGGLTVYLKNDIFIKMKPTILYSLFALALLIGLALKRFFLKSVFSEVMKLTDQGWRLLTIRWAAFFIVLALLNEAVWRHFSESTWVTYKVFGTLPLIMIFAALQVGLLKKYEAHG